MKISNTREISSKRINALIVGDSGVGKTSLARTLPADKTLIISAESGLLSLKGTNIDVIEINSLDDLIEVYKFLSSEKRKYEHIFIDSLTEISQKCLESLSASPEFKERKMAMAMYGEYSKIMTGLIKGFRDLTNYSVFMTCLPSYEQDGLVQKISFNMVGTKVKDSLMAWFDESFHMQIFDNGEKKERALVCSNEISPLAKDRSGCLEKYEKPDLSALLTKILE